MPKQKIKTINWIKNITNQWNSRIKNIKDVPYEIYIVLYNLYEKAIEQNVVLKIQIKTINSILAKIGFYLFEMDIETRKKYIDFAFTTYNEENRYKVLVEVDEKKEELFKKFLDEICIKQNIFFINSEEKIIYKHQEKQKYNCIWYNENDLELIFQVI